jgi:hypothetical protein
MTLTVLSRSGKLLSSTTFSGIHDKQTSEIYSEEISLPSNDGDDDDQFQQLTMTHTGGQKFKVTGISLCT